MVDLRRHLTRPELNTSKPPAILLSILVARIRASPQLTKLSSNALPASEFVQASNALRKTSAWNDGRLHKSAVVKKRSPEFVIHYCL